MTTTTLVRFNYDTAYPTNMDKKAWRQKARPRAKGFPKARARFSVVKSSAGMFEIAQDRGVLARGRLPVESCASTSPPIPYVLNFVVAEVMAARNCSQDC